MSAHQAPRPWDSPGKNTGVGCHFLLQCMKVKSESEVIRVRLFTTPWTAAHQAPLSMGFSRQEYWSGLPLPSPARKGIELQDRMQVYMMGPAILSSSFIKVKKIAFFFKKKVTVSIT